MSLTIEPEPSAEEREAILAALFPAAADVDEGWAGGALLEAVEGSEIDP